MKIVYAQEYEVHNSNKYGLIPNSIFLIGPTPRNAQVKSWRLEFLELLEKQGFTGIVFVPEPRTGTFQEGSEYYEKQVQWENIYLNACELIVAWIPRDLDLMPAFTTNIEFGRYIDSKKILYGRPDDAPKNRYLDWLYRDVMGLDPINNMEDLAVTVVYRLGGGGRSKIAAMVVTALGEAGVDFKEIFKHVRLT